MSVDDLPIATGGIYNHVSLLDKEPRFREHKHWLALVYTVPEFRGKGVGADLCGYIEQHAQTLGLEQIHLFTHTAERLYKRLGWQELERLRAGEKDIVVMQKFFSEDTPNDL
jgi:GNAT superfamily N-acetyltransferase